MEATVLVEIRVSTEQGVESAMQEAATLQDIAHFRPDIRYAPVPADGGNAPPSLSASGERSVIIRGMIEETKIREIEAHDSVIKVWRNDQANRRHLAWAVLLAAVVPITCNLILNAFDFSGFSSHAFEKERGTLKLLAVGDLVAILNFSYLFSPMFLGFWAAFAWRGRHLHFKDYVLLGLIVGAMAITMQLAVEPFLQRHFLNVSISEFFDGLFVRFVLFAYFLTPALMFIAGGLFGDWWRLRNDPSALSEFRFAGRIASWLPGIEVNSRVVTNIQLLGTLAAALLGLISALIGLIAATL